MKRVAPDVVFLWGVSITIVAAMVIGVCALFRAVFL